jgi:hypothetical protein
MSNLPADPRAFAKRKKLFSDWLLANGSSILAVTNSYELMRFTSAEGVGVIYRNEAGRLKWVGGSDKAYQCFVNAKPWRACERAERESLPARKRRLLYCSLVERDGDTCLYCGLAVSLAEFSIEHIVSVTHGGTSHMANLAITHEPCNARASHLSAREKFGLAMRMRERELAHV